MKVCSKCGFPKPLGDFHRWHLSPDGHKHQCKKCCKQYVEANRERFRDYDRRSKTGVSLVQYDEAFARQGGRCLTCGEPGVSRGTPENRAMAADHCHQTGEFRGLLCGSCNTLLGRLETNLGRFKNLVDHSKLLQDALLGLT